MRGVSSTQCALAQLAFVVGAHAVGEGKWMRIESQRLDSDHVAYGDHARVEVGARGELPLSQDIVQTERAGVQAVRGAFVYKVSDVADVHNALCLLTLYFNREHKYAVRIFADRDEHNKTHLVKALAGDVDIQIIVDSDSWHKLPASLSQEQRYMVLASCGVSREDELKTNPPCTSSRAPVGYVHMGYWRYGQMAQEPAMQAFDYFIWFDANAYLSGPLPVDPFELMRANDLVGFFNIEAFQLGDVAAGLQDAVSDLFTKEERSSRYLSSTSTQWFDEDGVWGGHRDAKPSVWGCFLGGRLDFFHQDRYRQLVDRMAFHTYLNRTDEQAVIGAGWSLLADNTKIWYLPKHEIHLGVMHSGWLDNSEMRVPQPPEQWTSLDQIKYHTLDTWNGFTEHQDLANPIEYLKLKDFDEGFKKCVDPNLSW